MYRTTVAITGKLPNAMIHHFRFLRSQFPIFVSLSLCLCPSELLFGQAQSLRSPALSPDSLAFVKPRLVTPTSGYSTVLSYPCKSKPNRVRHPYERAPKKTSSDDAFPPTPDSRLPSPETSLKVSVAS
ncbi:hypothetical protein K474DRAFT_83758 [Panus rudis PR-1116 ss-1]|nr:hypothetical protein K474DRAFT_83758 [Panus rudis PR-1116 ss-1]